MSDFNIGLLAIDKILDAREGQYVKKTQLDRERNQEWDNGSEADVVEIFLRLCPDRNARLLALYLARTKGSEMET